jgi:PEP-CTERM motif
MSLSPRSSLLALAGAAVLSMSAPAQAAIYTGTFDPAFGGNFSGLGWRGEVRIDVPQACLDLGNANSTNDVECQSISLQLARLELYDVPAESQTPDVMNVLNAFSLFGIEVAGGTVVGINASMFIGQWVAPAGTLVAPVVPWYDSYRYGLDLFGDEATLAAYSTSVGTNSSTGNTEDLLPGNCPWDGDYAICTSATNAKITFTRLPNQVPEPGSLLLAGAALAAAAATRRRRR